MLPPGCVGNSTTRTMPVLCLEYPTEMEEFQEIAHAGGKIIFHITHHATTGTNYQIQVQHCRPVPVAMIAIYALAGVPVAGIKLGGIGDAWDPPPLPGC